MTSAELKNEIVNIMRDKLAGDITIVDIAKQTVVADYFVIATGKSATQVRAISDTIEEKLEQQGIFVERKEGIREGRWVVLDYLNIIVHIFNGETRDFYGLEKLWSTGTNVTKIED